MTRTVRSRIEALERLVGDADRRPLWVSVGCLKDLERLSLSYATKVYIGISPDDWDDDQDGDDD